MFRIGIQAGRILGLYTVVMDITARKLAERVLSESEERFRSIADSAPVPMWVSRLDGLRGNSSTAPIMSSWAFPLRRL